MSSSCIHVASFAVSVSVIYSVLVDNKTTVSSLLEHQLTELSFGIKIKPEVDFRLSKSPA